MDKLWDAYPLIKEDLNYAVEIMEQNVKCKDKVIENSLMELIHSGGKLLRPAFVIISSQFGDYDKNKACSLAAVLEMLHMATLVHDDIIDDSKLRRGKETIQSKYGKDYAVYIGDFLFCKCFKILSESSTLKDINVDSNSMTRICLGEIDQLNSRFNKNVSIKAYLKRTASKTAELFSLSLYTGAVSSSCGETLSKQFWNIGHNIGMAFQIIDDILDYAGDEKTLGKSSAIDLRQGIITLPVIYALSLNNSDFTDILNKTSYSDEDINYIVDFVRESGSLEKSREAARSYSGKAFKLIRKLPDTENRNVLLNITEKLLHRIY